ncbi:MAG: diaminopimelate decarboxylase [Cytophagia bacterium]|nr:diaminopimelate decarboxylase [Cytophagia bacterium]
MFNSELTKKLTKLKTPFYFYDLDLLDKTILSLKESLDANYSIYYAIKANNNSKIIKLIKDHDLGIDAVSGEEINKSLNNSIKPKKIVFAGVGKTKDEIIFAIRKKIYLFNCESFDEISLIDKISNELNVKTKIAIRLNPNIDSRSHKYIKTGMFDSKFGIQIDHLAEILEKIKKLNHIDLKGYHFHLGSQIDDLGVFRKLCKVSNEMNIYLKNKNFNITDINLGGGLGINYKEPDLNLIPDFKSYFQIFKRNLIYFDNQKIHFELGRSIVGQSGSLFSSILYLKKSFNKHFIIIDAGMTELIRPALYNAQHHIENLSSSKKENKYDIVGPLCESSDTFAKDYYLNQSKIGDLIVIRSTGAYGEVMSSNYNLREKVNAYYSNELF